MSSQPGLSSRQKTKEEVKKYPQVGGNLWITVDNTGVYEDNGV
jgi:hypothetical protein